MFYLYRYSVNTFSRVQTNTQTGKQRKVQRVMEDAPPPDVSPRMSSTPTPAGKPIVPPIGEHQMQYKVRVQAPAVPPKLFTNI